MSIKERNSDSQQFTSITIEINRVLNHEEKAAFNRQLRRFVIQRPVDKYGMRIRTAIRTISHCPLWKIFDPEIYK